MAAAILVAQSTSILAAGVFPFSVAPDQPFTPSGQTIAAAWGDYDGDGRPDLFLAPMTEEAGRLYRNTEAGLERVLTGPVAEDVAARAGAVWVDVDDDGDLDLFVVTTSGADNLLYRNEGGGVFSAIRDDPSVSSGGAGQGCAAADIDRDGWMDLFVANGGGLRAEPDFLFRNDFGKGFRRELAGAFNETSLHGMGGTFADYDGDGYPDLFIANIWDENLILRNDGTGVFIRANAGALGGSEPIHNAASAAWGDYDNDGDPDLFVTHGVPANGLYRNEQGSFARVSSTVAIAASEANGTAWADFDNDGWLDLLVVQRNGAHLLYRGIGAGEFEPVVSAAIVTDEFPANGMALADYDLDGDVDVLLTNWRPGDASRLYRNETTRNHWLRVRLRGGVSNRFGVGARVRVRAMIDGVERWQMRTVGGEDSAGSQELMAHFGLGDASVAEVIRVEWPSGHVQELSEVAADQTVTVNESALLRVIPSGDVYEQPVSVVVRRGLLPAEVRYTTDGTVPTMNSPLYSEPLRFERTTTLTVGAFFQGELVGSQTHAFEVRPVAPVIVSHPQSQTVVSGSLVVFTVEATGTPPLVYRWYHNDALLPAATNSVLELTAAEPETYYVEVSNAAGTARSVPATLTVRRPVLEPVTSGAVAEWRGEALACAWADYDGDGDLDLFVTQTRGRPNALFRNQGNGMFEPVTDVTPVMSPGNHAGVGWADYDNDGDLDLFVNEFDRGTLLYENLGGGAFAAARILASVGVTGALAGGWADYDGNGLLDLYVSRGGSAFSAPGQLYRQRAAGIFEPVTGDGIGSHSASSMAAAWADYNGDGHPDLFVANAWGSHDWLYRNNGAGELSLITEIPFGTENGQSSGVAWGDYDGDADLDLFVTYGGHERSVLYNYSSWSGFTNVHGALPTQEPALGVTAAWGDYDNDGWLDLFVSHRGQSNALYQNIGGAFRRVTDEPAVTGTRASNGCAWGDYDDDGFLDLFVANWDGQSGDLYHNTGYSNAWLKVRCIGMTSNRSAIGAKVFVTASINGWPRRQIREITSGDGFGGPELVAHFGLGDATRVEVLRIEWPSGLVEEFHDLAVRQTINVTEGPVDAPQIIEPPMAQTVPIGARLELHVTATGLRPGYQWFRDGNPIEGATEASFLIELATADDSGRYHVRIVGPGGAVESDPVEVNVVVERILELAAPEPVREGARVIVPLRLTSDGDVGGGTIVIRHDVERLAEPTVTWGVVLANAFTQVNTETAGRTRLVFVLPASGVLRGEQILAEIEYRARSVGADVSTRLELEAVDLADPTGAAISFGTQIAGTDVDVLHRQLLGDNNGNDRLDVGDATVLLRFLSSMEAVRPWDIRDNDLNGTGTLDTGDVIRVLRRVIGLDEETIPTAPGKRRTVSLHGHGRESAHGALRIEPRTAGAGELVRVRVELSGEIGAIAGASFTLRYPPEALRLVGNQSITAGPLVPSSALALWNVSPANDFAVQDGVVRFAASSAQGWPTVTGAIAELVFEVQAGADGRHRWPLLLEQLELTKDGYQTVSGPIDEVDFIGREALPGRFGGLARNDDGTWSLRLIGEPETTYRVETSVDLVTWTEISRVRASAEPIVVVTDPEPAATSHRFYRAWQERDQ